MDLSAMASLGWVLSACSALKMAAFNSLAT
jgi:hypothetical protein